MKGLKKKWESELESMMPELNREILEEPIPERESGITKRKRPMFKYLSVACSIAAVIVLCICIIPLINSKAGTGEQSTLITVEINPRVIFVSNNEGVVTNVIATNEDADIVISSEGFDESVIGKITTEAIVNYVDYAIKLGFIDPEKTENAVKLTVSDDRANKTVLKDVKSSLETHFKQKGVYAVVIDNVATVEKICEINEIEQAEKLEEIVKEFENKSPLYKKRQMEEMDEKELIKQYKSNLMTDEVKGSIKESMSELRELLKIKSLNEKIMAQNEQGLDYWSLNEKETVMFPELLSLMEEMKANLGEIERNSGIKVESYDALMSLTRELSVEDVERMLEELEKDNSFDNAQKYKDVLEIFGKDTTEIDKIINMPQSKDEILKEAEDKLKEESNNRIENNKEGYEKEREEIDSSAYDKFVGDMKENHGDLGDWNKKEK